MSDGPHKSLPMKRPWKAVAKVADTEATSMLEIVPRMLNALSKDWREEVTSALQTALRDIFDRADQRLMFPEQRRSELDRLSREAAGLPLARVLIECADQALTAGQHGEPGLEDAARRALELHVTRGLRQVEEHYLRESTAPRAGRVRDNLEQAAAACDLTSWARRLTRIEDGPTTVRLPKSDGLDDGAPL